MTENYKKVADLLNPGLNHGLSVSPNSYLKTSLIYSRNGIYDKVHENLSADTQRINFNSDIVKTVYRLSSVYHHKIERRHKINIGLRFNLLNEAIRQSKLDDNNRQSSLIDFDEPISSIQSCINWRFQANKKLIMVGGIHNTNILHNNNKYT